MGSVPKWGEGSFSSAAECCRPDWLSGRLSCVKSRRVKLILQASFQREISGKGAGTGLLLLLQAVKSMSTPGNHIDNIPKSFLPFVQMFRSPRGMFVVVMIEYIHCAACCSLSSTFCALDLGINLSIYQSVCLFGCLCPHKPLGSGYFCLIKNLLDYWCWV